MTLIVCGAPLTARAPDVVRALAGDGYRVSVVGTPAAAGWLDVDAVTELCGEAPRLRFREPNEGVRSEPPAAAVVCPGTFNTLNKAVIGAADTYGLGRLCEAIAMRLPLVVVPLVSPRLWGHPAWANSLATLRALDAVLLDPRTGGSLTSAAEADPGGDLVADFDPAWVTAALRGVVRRP